MKRSIFLRSLVLNFLIAAFSLALCPIQSYAQTGYDSTTPVSSETTTQGPLLVSIKKYHISKTEVHLYVINPEGGDSFIYFQKTYKVFWFKDGEPLGQGPMVSTKNCGNIKVLVVNLRNGARGSDGIFLGACKQSPDSLSPFSLTEKN